MKRIVLSTVFTLFAFLIFAQEIHLSVLSGYTFRNRFDIFRGRAEIEDSHALNAILGVAITPQNIGELQYYYAGTRVNAYSAELDEDIDESANIHYILIGGSRNAVLSDAFSANAGLKIGMGIVGSPSDNFDDEYRFVISFGGGLKYFATEKVGIHLGAQMFMPVVGAGASLWWSPGSGTSVGVSTWSPLVQFNLQGGLVFRFGS